MTTFFSQPESTFSTYHYTLSDATGLPHAAWSKPKSKRQSQIKERVNGIGPLAVNPKFVEGLIVGVYGSDRWPKYPRVSERCPKSKWTVKGSRVVHQVQI